MKDMSKQQFAAALARHGMQEGGFLGYVNINVPGHHVEVSKLNAGSYRRHQLAYLLHERDKAMRECACGHMDADHRLPSVPHYCPECQADLGENIPIAKNGVCHGCGRNYGVQTYTACKCGCQVQGGTMTPEQLREPLTDERKPKIVVLCGSTRFVDIMAVCAWLIERNEGAIALGLHLLPRWYPDCPDDHLAEAEGVKDAMDNLHMRKIDLCDEVFVVNVRDYIGNSTRREIAHAQKLGKPLRWFNMDPIGEAVTNMLEKM